jgi:ABC-type dipeptide/oligopeptide/nickel transport system permease subunit
MAAPIPEWGTLRQKQRNQVKSKFYYIFWGVATASVVLGQLYVGSGYRIFAGSLNRIFDTIEIEVGRDYNGERFY